VKRRNLAIAFCIGLLIFTSITIAQSKRPPKATLSVEITTPSDGIIVENEGSFIVSGTIVSRRGDAGDVDSYVQYSIGEGTSDFNTVDGSTFQIIVGDHPQSQNLLRDESYSVFWELKGSPGAYEIRIFSEAILAKDGSSESRTVIIEGPPPPPDIETIDNEYQDPETGFGTASGTYVNTYLEDGSYEILSEEKNTHGTRKPVDDTTEMGWIFVFKDLPTRQNTVFTIIGHAEFPSDDSDSKFYFQIQSGDSWIPILEYQNRDVDRLITANIPDDSSTIIILRVLDNDQTLGNKIISQLYIDQAYINFEQTNEFNIADIDGGIGSRGVKIGDVDNDGENEISVLLGTPSGSWEIRVYEFNSGNWDEQIIADNSVGGWELAIGDVDNDLLNEIVVGFTIDSQGYELRYYEFDGSSWIEHNIANPDAAITSLVIGDVDHDGLNEVAAGFLAQGTGYELRYYKYESGGWSAYNVENNLHECDGLEIADIDHDGVTELVYAGYGGGGYQVLSYYKYFSDSWTRYDILNTPTSWGIDAGDVDNDGNIEIAWGAYGLGAYQDEVRVYKYESNEWHEYIVSDVTGGWTSETHGTDIKHVAIGDLDNDGLNELAIGLEDTPTRPSHQTIRYYEFDSGTWIEYNVSDPDATVEVVEIGDIDNDGENELLIGLSPTLFELRYYEIEDYQTPLYTTEILIGDHVGLGNNNLVIYEKQKDVWFNDLNVPTSHGYIIDIIIADIDGDGYMETLTSGMHNSTQSDPGLVQVWENIGGNMQLIYTLPATRPDKGVFSVSVGDIDNDNSQDLEIVTCADCLFADPYYTIIWKKVDGRYVPSYNITQFGACDSMTTGNIDSDTNTEIVISTWNGEVGGSMIAIWENQSGGWVNTANYTFEIVSPPDHLEIMDIDGDGINELLASFYGNIYGFDYTGSSLENVWVSPETVHGGFSVGDVSNDGKDDIVAMSTASEIVIYEVISGNLVNTINIPIADENGVYKNGVDVGDIDNDGQNEYVLAIGNKLYIFRNESKIYEKIIFPEGSRTFALVIGDYDNDALEIPNPGLDRLSTKTSKSCFQKSTEDHELVFLYKEELFVTKSNERK